MLSLSLPSCPSTAEELPVAPEASLLAAAAPLVPIMELQSLNYSCSVNANKTYLPGATWDNMFGLMCLPGGVWQSPAPGEWPVCSDPTTTTPAPTTTVPPRSKQRRDNGYQITYFPC